MGADTPNCKNFKTYDGIRLDPQESAPTGLVTADKGALYVDSTYGDLYVWSGSAWGSVAGDAFNDLDDINVTSLQVDDVLMLSMGGDDWTNRTVVSAKLTAHISDYELAGMSTSVGWNGDWISLASAIEGEFMARGCQTSSKWNSGSLAEFYGDMTTGIVCAARGTGGGFGGEDAAGVIDCEDDYDDGCFDPGGKWDNTASEYVATAGLYRYTFHLQVTQDVEDVESTHGTVIYAQFSSATGYSGDTAHHEVYYTVIARDTDTSSGANTYGLSFTGSGVYSTTGSDDHKYLRFYISSTRAYGVPDPKYVEARISIQRIGDNVI